ncbi:MAG: hypothetical protein M4D80_17640 [Myxococcota bacterium]|nr:hypothetical protein [Deltaproteobacteria bacterium]MDQ3336987.1 hypothetical protein [Myxococcota bacterium]
MQNAARRAAWLGALCAFGPGAILFGWYYAKHHQTVAMPWTQIALVSLVLAPLTGASFGGLIRWFAERSGRPIASGVIGGALASIVPGIFAVAVFGSMRGPYAGSIQIAVMNIAACAALAIVMTTDALPKRSLAKAIGIVLLAAGITAALTLGTAYAVAPSLFTDNGIFFVARGLAKQYGGVPIGVLLGVIVGAIVGLHLGLCLALARRPNVAAT